ncbi:MAG: hypothetical protein ABIU05_07135 [Nitrospirales bacterium]
MHTQRNRATTPYPLTEGNLAIADESLIGLQQPSGVFQQTARAKTLSLVQGGAPDITEALNADALSPARGIVVGIGLSIMLWCVIISVIYWVR